MTAEVAILNKQAVVLAADSAVTTSDGKIFNTAKLFALSKSEPVGIMAYSSAEVMGVPVETVIKEFRRIQGPQTHQHLENYAQEFAEFLRTNDTVFGDDERALSLSGVACGLAQDLYDTALCGMPEGWSHPTRREAQDALSDAIAEFEQRINAAQIVQISQPRKARQLLDGAIGDRLTRSLERLGQKLPTTKKAEAKVRKLILDSFFRDVDGGGETGFVIAGFGTADIFPRLRSFEFRYSALPFHRIVSGRAADISVGGHIARIMPFAQADVMATFVEGIGPKYRAMLLSLIGQYFETHKNNLLNDAPPKANEAALVEALGNGLVQQLPQYLGDLADQAFVQPTMQVVASMPKEELAILAEALINLTTLKRKASTDAETVGGPTDVAVISKGDGFVWIKRKHYFDMTFNPGFIADRLPTGGKT